jgi:hypothetical protein
MSIEEDLDGPTPGALLDNIGRRKGEGAGHECTPVLLRFPSSLSFQLMIPYS